jgi:light-harvesting protein B-800-850 alpha chain
MIYGKIWCVVKPTVGIPLFLGSVAVTSLVVHGAILGNTTWYKRYWEGKPAVVATADSAGASAQAPVRK